MHAQYIAYLINSSLLCNATELQEEIRNRLAGNQVTPSKVWWNCMCVVYVLCGCVDRYAGEWLYLPVLGGWARGTRALTLPYTLYLSLIHI